jgi:streptogrisin C
VLEAVQLRRWSVAVALLVLVLAFVAVVGGARAEDPQIQREMATSYAGKFGLGVDQAQERIERQDRLVKVADKVREALGDAYAGIWFDNSDDGRMKIGIAASASAADPSLVWSVQTLLAANGAKDDADLVRVATTQRELAAEHEKVDGALAEELQTGKVMTSVDPEKNSVTVEIGSSLPDSERASIAAAARDAAPDVQVEDSPDVQGEFQACVRRTSDNALFCGNPFRGGVTIGTSLGYCTAGFVTFGNSGGNPWLLTAGHCLRDGGSGTWSSRDNSLTLHDIGTRHSWTVGSGGDYGIISFSTAYWNTSPYIVYDGASTWNETYHIFDAGTSYVGMPICATGSRLLSNGHYTDCGSVTQLDVTGSAGGTTVLHLGRANLCVNLGGNSGGPFYKEGHAYGLFSIGVSACDELYQGAVGALNGSNVHLPG